MAPAQPLLVRYVDLLATQALDQGLIGPREVPRLWERHILNCAAVADPAAGLIATDAVCVDVGSGAGLPGLVWAAVRPDLHLVLVEPLLRRSAFLAATVAELGLDERVRVIRGRAEDQADLRGTFEVVTARAVAPLDRLLGWTVPLLRPGGSIVLLKGQSAAQELADADAVVRRSGLVDLTVTSVGAEYLTTPTVLIVGHLPTAQ